MPKPSQNGQRLLFARAFFRHPRMLGSVIPSSRFLIREVLDRVDWARARVIVEYGPGVGTITGEILDHMREDAMLIAIETNPEFVRYLREGLRDHRLHVVQRSAADVRAVLREHGADKASYIISGIPFSTLPRAQREHILLESRAALEPGGAFLVYQFSSRVLEDLRRVFGKVERGFELFNILPAHLFFCTPAGTPKINGHAV
ncbi:MAG: NAD-binding protein [Steroidobacteraceae bacterium]|nr:NAD-binding protein [Steroidobacteraceae bacterium]